MGCIIYHHAVELIGNTYKQVPPEQQTKWQYLIHKINSQVINHTCVYIGCLKVDMMDGLGRVGYQLVSEKEGGGCLGFLFQLPPQYDVLGVDVFSYCTF